MSAARPSRWRHTSFSVAMLVLWILCGTAMAQANEPGAKPEKESQVDLGPTQGLVLRDGGSELSFHFAAWLRERGKHYE